MVNVVMQFKTVYCQCQNVTIIKQNILSIKVINIRLLLLNKNVCLKRLKIN